MVTLTKTKTDKYDTILRDSSIDAEISKLPKDEQVELKSHAMKKAVKIKKYVRN